MMAERKKALPTWLTKVSDNRYRFDLALPVGKTSSPQDLAFDPQSKADIKPKDEDYVRVEFRAISARYLGESGYFLDFSDQSVLFESIPLMLDKSRGGIRRVPLKFHRNHSHAVEAVIGWVDAAAWNVAAGQQSAPGINIETMIDWKLAPNEVRQLLSDPPLVESVSISFMGEFERSHPDMDFWTFIDMLGHEVDGETVRVLVTKIYEYDHVGLVTEGADEEADMVDNDPDELGTGNNQIRLHKSTNSGEVEMKDVLALTEKELSTLCGLLDCEKIESFKELTDAIGNIAWEAGKVEELQGEIETLKETKEQFDSLLSTKRDAVKKLIVKVDGEGSKAMQSVCDKMDFAELSELEETYSTRLEAKYPLRCAACGSTNVERRSSVEELAEPEPGKKGKKAVNEGDYKVGKGK